MTGSRLFAARFHGRCADCEEPIEPGDRVAFDEDNELICAGCVWGEPRRPARARPEKVCPGCHLVHAGSCEDAR